MASLYQNGSDDRKASSLTDNTGHRSAGKTAATATVTAAATATESSRNARHAVRDRVRRTGERFWISLIVDVLLLCVLAGLIVGGWFGYRALREWYAPTWETRDVVFCVEMQGIAPDMVKYGQDGRPTFTNNAIWSSNRTNADCLGTVTDVRTVLVAWDDGTNTLTLYLTVEATADYREGKGYRMGETMLLAGSKGSYRVQGMTAEGMIISMHEAADETEVDSEADTVWVDPEAVDPEAQG